MLTLVIRLSDAEVLDLYRIVVDQEAEEALAFLERRVRPALDEKLEGG